MYIPRKNPDGTYNTEFIEALEELLEEYYSIMSHTVNCSFDLDEWFDEGEKANTSYDNLTLNF